MILKNRPEHAEKFRDFYNLILLDPPKVENILVKKTKKRKRT